MNREERIFRRTQRIWHVKPCKTKRQVVGERLTWVRNEAKFGTQSKAVIENAFIRRAKRKIEFASSFMMVWWLLLLVFLLLVLLAVTRLINFHPPVRLLQCGFVLVSVAYFFVYKCFVIPKVIRRYWSCPHCGQRLPIQKYGGARYATYLVPNGDEATCPYCGEPFPEILS